MSYLWGPINWIDTRGTSTVTGLTLNSNAAQSSGSVAVGSIAKVKKAGSINKVCFYVTTVNGTGNTYEAVVLTTSAGLPTASLYGGSAAQSQAISATGYTEVTLGTPATFTRGDLVFVGLRCISGTDYATNSITVLSTLTLGNSGGVQLPYSATNTAGTWSRVGSQPLIAPRVDDGTYGQVVPLGAASPLTSASYSTSTNPDERGMKFQVPFEGRCSGARIQIDIATLGTDTYDVNLYNADSGALLASATVGTNEQMSNALGSIDVWWANNGTANQDGTASTGVAVVSGTNGATLSPTINYRLTVRPTTTSALRYAQFVAPNADARNAIPHAGESLIVGATRNNVGAWTDETVAPFTVPLFGLWFETMVTDPEVTIINTTTQVVCSVFD